MTEPSVQLIQHWWRKHTSLTSLKKVHSILKEHLREPDLQRFVNMCKAISYKCNGDGAGLSSGTLIDMLLCEFLRDKLPATLFTEYHDGECDLKIGEVPLSMKKINGKSTIALDWSKNKNTTKTKIEYFNHDILIINLKTEQWWKNTPRGIGGGDSNIKIKISYNDCIPSGIYLIDKLFCKYYITLSCNNKTNSLIESVCLYKMLKRSILLDLWIALPPSNETLDFQLLKSFP